MFDLFFKFVNMADTNNPDSMDAFLKLYDGKTFLNGLYRICKLADVEKWNGIVEDAFPSVKGQITVFGYDWLGRVFTMFHRTNTVVMFEPGTGEAFNTSVDFVNFHNVEIVEYHKDCLASEFFDEWYQANGNYVLPHDKCAGYKVPLFLSGEDTIDNLEISDMEVYWGIMAPLIKA